MMMMIEVVVMMRLIEVVVMMIIEVVVMMRMIDEDNDDLFVSAGEGIIPK